MTKRKINEQMEPRNDHDLLIELSVNTKEILRRLDTVDKRQADLESKLGSEVTGLHTRITNEIDKAQTQFKQTIDGFGIRLEKVEGFRWYMLGILAVISVALSVAFKIAF